MSRKKQTSYYHIKFYDRFLKDFIRNEKKFREVKTTYSRKLKTEKKNIFFNKDGDTDILLLSIINNVRKDAKEFLEKNNKISNEPFDYFGLLDKPVLQEVVCKVDIRGAYWQYALNNGIITQDTNYKLVEGWKKLRERAEERGEFLNPKKFKEIRLAALGALATEHHIIDWENGKRVNEEVLDEPTKQLYIDINRGIDKLIHEAAGVVSGCFYYYWDCIFMRREFTQEAIDFFRSKEYDVHIEETVIEFIPISSGMLLSLKDDKIYMCRRENRHLLEEFY